PAALYRTAPDRGGVTSSEVTLQFALLPNVARHHLDKLAAGGYLDVHLERPEHPGAGRPSKRYRGSPKDMELEFPARRDDLLATLLGRAIGLLPTDVAEALAEEVGAQYGRALAAQMAPGEGQRP